MSTTTLNLHAATWYKDYDTTNHSSDAWLKAQWPTPEGDRGYHSILQFEIPTALKYKRIQSVKLNFYTVEMTQGGQYDEYTWATWVSVAPYICNGSALSSVTGATLETLGQIGEAIENKEMGWLQFPIWRQIDVTSIFSSNLYNYNYFTVILSCFPGIAGWEDDLYSKIGGIGSGYAATLTITYEDVTQLPPTPSYPVGAYVNENTNLLFSWAWNSTTAAVQASVQLEYKLASAGSWTVVSLTQSAHTYTLAGGLPQGAYQWRIKGTNDAGEVSDYSTVAEFSVIGKPSAPYINDPTNAALTTITWQANDQNSYDLTLTDSEGKELVNVTVGSSATSYKPNLLLKGTYTVGVRYRNSSGLSSDWSYKTFSITAAGPAKPTMTLYGNSENARIVVDSVSGLQYAIVRAEEPSQNYEVIGLIQNANEFIDRTAKFNTSYCYKVRAYASAGYTDSDVARFRCNSKKVALQTDDIEVFLDTSKETFLPHSERQSREMATYKCEGRRYRVVEHGDTDDYEFNTSLFVTEAQKAQVSEIAKEDYIFYRDYSGRAFPVAIQALSFNRYMDVGYIASIEMIRIAEREVVVNV